SEIPDRTIEELLAVIKDMTGVELTESNLRSILEDGDFPPPKRRQRAVKPGKPHKLHPTNRRIVELAKMHRELINNYNVLVSSVEGLYGRLGEPKPDGLAVIQEPPLLHLIIGRRALPGEPGFGQGSEQY